MTQRPTGRGPSRPQPSRPRRPGEKPADDKKRPSQIVVVGGGIALVLAGILVIVFAVNFLSGLRPGHSKTITQPASGKILIDKKGVEGLNIVLWPVNDDQKTPRPHAVTGPGGVFKLGTYGEDDGAPPGEYKLSVQWFEPVAPRKDEPEEITSRDKLFGRYSDPNHARALRVHIKPGVEEIEVIQLP